jgi:chromosome segregation ATPase
MMAVQINGGVFGQPSESRLESPENILPGKSLQQIKDLIDSVKRLSAGDSFKHADGLFHEMSSLKQTAGVNQDEVQKLKSQLAELKTNHTIAKEEFLEVHRGAMKKLNDENTNLEAKLDQSKIDLTSQAQTNEEQSQEGQRLKHENMLLSKENQNLRETVSQAESRAKELERKSTEKDSTIKELQKTLREKDLNILSAKDGMSALEQKRETLKNEFDATKRALKTLTDYCYPLTSGPHDEM